METGRLISRREDATDAEDDADAVEHLRSNTKLRAHIDARRSVTHILEGT